MDLVLADPVRGIEVEALRTSPFFADDLVPFFKSVDIGEETLVFGPALNDLNTVLPLSKYLLDQRYNF